MILSDEKLSLDVPPVILSGGILAPLRTIKEKPSPFLQKMRAFLCVHGDMLFYFNKRILGYGKASFGNCAV